MRAGWRTLLAGRTVALIGDQFYSRMLKTELEAKGASVVYPRAASGGVLADANAADAVVRDVLALHPRPDIVVVYHPRLDLHEGSLHCAPAVELARRLTTHGVPTLILDHFRAMDSADERTLQDAGARFASMQTFHAGHAALLVSRILAQHSRNDAPPERL